MLPRAAEREVHARRVGDVGRERVRRRRARIEEDAAAQLPGVAQLAFGAEVEVDRVVPVLRLLRAMSEPEASSGKFRSIDWNLRPADPDGIEIDDELLDRVRRDAHRERVGLDDGGRDRLIVDRAREAARHVVEVRLAVVEVELHRRCGSATPKERYCLIASSCDADVAADAPRGSRRDRRCRPGRRSGCRASARRSRGRAGSPRRCARARSCRPTVGLM